MRELVENVERFEGVEQLRELLAANDETKVGLWLPDMHPHDFVNPLRRFA